MQKYRRIPFISNFLIVLTISIVTLGVTTRSTLASGTYSPGGSGGDDYHMAKLIFYKKIVCDSCPFPGRGKNAEDAQLLLQEFTSNETVSPKERQATMSYLKRRFKLN